ncbi:enoyl-CoA hydratase [Actinomycetospora sp. TBRC 11914]|uniref:enoyl-CoA hydratase n=1 Tax=Actinomycetospora sp. TBRC 11914 TaxID=2729387 RepID=UPI00145DCB18|nr:enoyl-CoA hydratase [Actinomycetospora sp. TBRC 11914]NMO92175.1 enoyl-CoA hydratase [Actinomycetospora sp. TBRC 11914]
MIESHAHGTVTELRIARHDRRNALNTAHCRDLHAALDEAVAGGTRAVVLTGEGSAFCSGADLDTVGDAGFLDALYAMLQRVVAVPVPVIAAVHGAAIGAGTQLAIAADLRVAAERAVFALPTAALGLAVDPWTVRRLALLAGGGPARRMLLACERLDHAAALAHGLVDRTGSPEDALAWAAEIAELAPLTLAYNKLAVNRLFEDARDPETLDAVGGAFAACWASEDLVEGRRAREEKRPARFRGR